MRLTVHSLGGDRHRITIGRHELIVDQPREAGGEDAGPTPTDLFVASLASCVAHYARRGLGGSGGAPVVHCSWTMSKTPPWRVAAIAIDVTLPAATPDSRVAAVRRAVAHCTVHNSLLDPPMLTIATATAVPDAASVRLAAGARA
ncbi:MAG TPA: OsmC family protein [Candidatus Saccharimonadales bacterium]|nr:OsmC family protein [Candidatus Saccharimonadales bacterium]